eukprot:TRINITY_DN5404_c0_g1_i4.p1 TRINITY_DN5404_c0_g1~~TRINITY_DN5404_c0_g1_i4.p1  ORF type:complete len:100 (+),score=13.15 TRINITY_DN5404_c0_g1_i4:835-1134(+)
MRHKLNSWKYRLLLNPHLSPPGTFETAAMYTFHPIRLRTLLVDVFILIHGDAAICTFIIQIRTKIRSRRRIRLLFKDAVRAMYASASSASSRKQLEQSS